MRGIIALHRINIRIAARLGAEGLHEGFVLGAGEIVAIVQRCLDALGRLALRRQCAFSEKARAAQSRLELRGRIFLDELHRTAAGKEGADRIDIETGNLRQ